MHCDWYGTHLHPCSLISLCGNIANNLAGHSLRRHGPGDCLHQIILHVYHLKNLKARVEEVIKLTGLEKEQHKKIAQLSKGYKQRVGLAQAIIHDPKVLILDEPTSGLDPNQLIEIRALIKELGKTKTVVLSTHIMQEVEAICDDIVIINKGKIVANDTLTGLLNTHHEKSLEPIFVKLTKDID